MSTQSERHELIRASAGTGKTYELTNRYLRLLRTGQPPDEILASTFTRKAAGEILGRILLRLAQAATDEQKLAELQNALGDQSLTRSECLTMLAGTARRLHRLRISTLDSFFAQLAGSFALETGLPPGWRIVEEHEDAALQAQAIDSVLDNEDPANLLTLVHALTAGDTTRSLDHEVRGKIKKLYEVYRETVRDAWYAVPRMAELPEVQLAEAIEALRAVPLAQDRRWATGHDKDLAAAEARDWKSFVENGLAKAVAGSKDSYYGTPIDANVAAAYRPLIDHARAVLLNQLANRTEATYQLLDKFHLQYQRLKRRTRTLRFEDISLQLARRFAGGGDDIGRLAFRLDAHVNHLLLDEFQDTSLTQWSVIRPFAERIAEAASNQSFFCVGDTKQAIYRWRGGVAELFDAVTSEVAGVHQRSLDTSWRSSPHVIHAVNKIFRNVHRLGDPRSDLVKAIVRWQEQFHQHQAASPKQCLNGYVCLQAARTAKDDETDSQADITLRFVAERVAEWTRKAPGFEIGVLVRRNEAVRQLIYELRERGIEASEEGGCSLDDSAAVRLILSLVQLADHPGDFVARFHVATSPLATTLDLFGPADETSATSGVSDDGLQAAVRFASKQGDAVAGHLARLIRRQLADNGYGRTIYGLARQLAPACNRRELRRLEKLIGLAYRYDGGATSRPRDFATYVASTKVRDPISAEVRVMTVHQAKGLEFDIVVLADLEAKLIGQRDDLVVGRPSATAPVNRVCRHCNKDVQQLLPEEWQKLFREAEGQDVAESLSLLYVAVTRAVHALHMIVAPSPDGEKSLHRTFGGLLRAALTVGSRLTPEQIAYETGDREWFTSPGVERTSSVAEVALKAESLAPLEVKLAAPAERRWRGLGRLSPSGLEGGSRVRLIASSGANDTDRRTAEARGTVIHAWFEQIAWLDDGSPSDDRLREVAVALRDFALMPDDVDRWLTEFRVMLAQPNIAACLHRAAYRNFAGATLRVETERPFAVRDGDRLIVGSIDRLVTICDGNQPIAADILDFKTDSIADDDRRVLTEKVRFYTPQLHAYCQAVKKMTGLELQRISAKLLLLGPGLVAPIST